MSRKSNDDADRGGNGGDPPDGDAVDGSDDVATPDGRATAGDDRREEFDPAGRRERELGRGLFDEQMGPGSSMAHLYRGELHRMKLWRERLDQTTYWAVTVVAALLTWAFSSGGNPHYLILLGMIMVGIFLTIEARRYQGYDIWRARVRMMQQNVFAFGLDPSQGLVNPAWRRELGTDYREPTIKVPFEEAVAHRLQRVYLPIFAVLLGSWFVRLTAFSPGEHWLAASSIGRVPGVAVAAAVAVAYLGLAVIAFRPRTWHSYKELKAAHRGEGWRERD
jgi:uncharacterized membrane protein